MNSPLKKQPFEIYQRVLKAYQAGRYPEALAKYDQLLNDNPQNAFFLCFKGHILNELNRRAEAKEHFKLALELVKLGHASDFVIESDRLLSQMIIDKLIKLQDFLIRSELLSSKIEDGSLYKIRLEKAKITQIVLSRKVFDYLIPDDYKELSKLPKTIDPEFTSLVKEALERIGKLEEKLHVPSPKFKKERIEKTQIKLKKVEKIMAALQHEINSSQKGILNVKVNELNALLAVK